MRISDWSSDVCSSDLFPDNHTTIHGVIGEMISTNDSPPGVWCQLGDGEYLPSVHTDCCNRDSTAPSFLCCEYCRAIRSEERRVGKECAVRVDLGGRRILKKKKNKCRKSYDNTSRTNTKSK